MPVDRLEQSGLNRAWITAEAALPIEWRLEGLVCTSTGLQPEQRSDRWRAWAAGPNGETIEAEGDGPIAAPPRPGEGARKGARLGQRLIEGRPAVHGLTAGKGRRA
jgi:hypothetical protein